MNEPVGSSPADIGSPGSATDSPGWRERLLVTVRGLAIGHSASRSLRSPVVSADDLRPRLLRGGGLFRAAYCMFKPRPLLVWRGANTYSTNVSEFVAQVTLTSCGVVCRIARLARLYLLPRRFEQFAGGDGLDEPVHVHRSVITRSGAQQPGRLLARSGKTRHQPCWRGANHLRPPERGSSQEHSGFILQRAKPRVVA